MEFPNIWAEIDLGAIDHNVRELRRITHPGARFMAVVKADGYGHGAAPVARAALAAGVDMLAVARIDEGIALRQDGFEVPILVLNPTFPPFAAGLIEHNLIQSVTGLAAAQALNEAARTAGKTIPVHLKVDSGMGRLGLVPEAGRTTDHALPPVAEVKALARLPHVRIEGVYTHFAAADETDKTYARHQLEVFEAFIAALQAAGIACGLRHAANSAAIIDLPDSHLDAVRPGISLYGLYPSAEVDHSRIDLKPALALVVAVMLWYGAGLASEIGLPLSPVEPVSAGLLVAFIEYLDRLFRPLRELSARVAVLQRGDVPAELCFQERARVGSTDAGESEIIEFVFHPESGFGLTSGILAKSKRG